MITFIRRDADTFTLSLAGRLETYASDKAGKRQAILDGLATVATVVVADDVYLPDGGAVQVVAAILYPEGIRTKEAYQTVRQVTAKACAHLGYGEAVELGPPAVSFDRRGLYRRQQPPLDAQLIQEELDRVGPSGTEPRQEVARAVLWNRAALAGHDRRWHQLSPAEQARIQAQVDDIAAAGGWQIGLGEDSDLYVKPLPIDAATARQRLAGLLSQEAGQPISTGRLIYQVQLGAYGRGFYTDELAPALADLVADTLTANGYRPTPEQGEYRPVPFTLPETVVAKLPEKLAALTPRTTDFGPALLLSDVLAVVETLTEQGAPSAWQAVQLVEDGPLGQALRDLGYQAELTWCRPYHFQPRLTDSEAQQVILKEIRVENDPEKKLSLADGLAVHTPALVVDDDADTLVYLEMLGPKQSVKANWAALAGGGRVHWLGRQRIRLEGMKGHVRLQTTLACGWTDMVLIHKQASLKEMNPSQPFYLLDDGTGAPPPLFYAMLNKALALPLLPEWAGYLWVTGRERGLISLLNGGMGQGYAAWQVLVGAEDWEAVMQAGLKPGVIRF